MHRATLELTFGHSVRMSIRPYFRPPFCQSLSLVELLNFCTLIIGQGINLNHLLLVDCNTNMKGIIEINNIMDQHVDNIERKITELMDKLIKGNIHQNMLVWEDYCALKFPNEEEMITNSVQIRVKNLRASGSMGNTTG